MGDISMAGGGTLQKIVINLTWAYKKLHYKDSKNNHDGSSISEILRYTETDTDPVTFI